jgi:hypothetical protein
VKEYAVVNVSHPAAAGGDPRRADSDAALGRLLLHEDDDTLLNVFFSAPSRCSCRPSQRSWCSGLGRGGLRLDRTEAHTVPALQNGLPP